MNKKAIIQMFNDGNIQKRVNELRAENLLLTNQISKNKRLLHQLSTHLDNEQNMIADKLDGICPDWRKVLINELIQTQKTKNT